MHEVPGIRCEGGSAEVSVSASKSSIRRFVITEKAPTRAFSWLKVASTAFTFKTLLRHYAKQTLDSIVFYVIPYDNCAADPISRLLTMGSMSV